MKSNSSGNERTRISAAFTAVADGTKLPIFALIPRKNPINEMNNLKNAEVAYKSESTFDDEMIICYLNRKIIPYKLRKQLQTILLIIDHAPCHLTVKVKNFCVDNCIELLFIPPRLTNLLQPADVCWFASIKKSYKVK